MKFISFEKSTRTYGLVVKVNHSESGNLGSIPDDCWNSLPPLGHFAWHWACQCTVHWHARCLFCCALYNFSFLGFRQWRSRDDRVVNLNTTIWLALFWRTWSRARARTRWHVRAWHMCRDYGDCRASELTDRHVSGFVFFWFLENTEKMKASKETFLRLMPRTADKAHHQKHIFYYAWILCCSTPAHPLPAVLSRACTGGREYVALSSSVDQMADNHPRELEPFYQWGQRRVP